VYDPKQIFGLDENLVRQHEIGMLGHRSGQCVLDWNDRRSYRSLREAIENLRRPSARHHRTLRQHPLSRFMTEGAEFPLDRNFHIAFPG
jgi:hypothetical protein